MATELRPYVDRLIPGGLDAYLHERRAAGDTYEVLQDRLADDHEVKVTKEQVRKWCIEAGATERGVAESQMGGAA